MSVLRIIADDLTGACDVGAELSAAGLATRVTVDGDAADAAGDDLTIINTQSRTIGPGAAYERVLRLVRRRPADLLLKKIDTALRGHLGAELDAVLDGVGAIAAFILPAIPSAGRLTRNGCQWFGDRPLAVTEFARDPEGPGAESSIAAVLARESRRRTEVISTGLVRAGGLEERVRRLLRAGAAFFVVDAESDADLVRAIAAILELPRPLCLAGSIALAAAAAPHLAAELEWGHAPETTSANPLSDPLDVGASRNLQAAQPVLIVCGSLHSMARAQIAAAESAGLAVSVAVPPLEAPPERLAAAAAEARAHLDAGRTVALAAGEPQALPGGTARRATEKELAEIASIVVGAAPVGTLVLIGGETSHAVLTRLGATTLVPRGRFTPLVAVAEIADGVAAGTVLVTKGGSGGDRDTLARLLAGVRDDRAVTVSHVAF